MKLSKKLRRALALRHEPDFISQWRAGFSIEEAREILRRAIALDDIDEFTSHYIQRQDGGCTREEPSE